jgi:serine/threonine protein phosphatase 1
MRLIAIGDIHGHLDKLTSLLQIINPTTADQLVFLGDYIDRGPDPAGVISYLLELAGRFPQTVFLRGNHEQVMLDALHSADPDRLPGYKPLSDIDPLYQMNFQHRRSLDIWLRNDGAETLASYGIGLPVEEEDLALIPQDHVDFLNRTKLWYREQGFLFVHAGAREDRPLDQQTNTILRDRYCDPGIVETHVVGHQIVPGGLPHFEPGRYSLDTGAGWGDPLTGCNVLTREIWQS